MDILAIEDKEHVDALEFSRVSDQILAESQELWNCKPCKGQL